MMEFVILNESHFYKHWIIMISKYDIMNMAQL